MYWNILVHHKAPNSSLCKCLSTVEHVHKTEHTSTMEAAWQKE